jgi:hypothetical protein
MLTDVSEQNTASTFNEVYAKQETGMNQVAFLLGLLFNPKDGGNMFFRNFP